MDGNRRVHKLRETSAIYLSNNYFYNHPVFLNEISLCVSERTKISTNGHSFGIISWLLSSKFFVNIAEIRDGMP